MTILPFLGSSRKKRQMMAQEVKEFSELVKDQTCKIGRASCRERV